ncbi:hypothetical protein [Leptothoe sp. PORK10 BA2]|uniref:hypothetical protein n=1 Tax=Leptothoe sp. PORK10 BA2 TaxID=3110254 RepID=UPI002B215774|nr:hypothetical protein [Leptothoe sp. PORK10 BA2]MEA5464310.1 hypothetical protein [Leptothoe sp. PORK10 BA2]
MLTSNVPQLPPTEDGEASSLRYEVNPAIALNALSNIYQQVQQYQIQLRQLAQNIHQVYAEGPVVSGWLASEASLHAAVKYSNLPGDVQLEPSSRCDDQSRKLPLEATDVALFRHGDANDLMNYLSALEKTMLERGTSQDALASNGSSHSSSNGSRTATGASSNSTSTVSVNPSQYYLCRLSSSGQIQAEPCPPDQVPVLSMAIARYRRLKEFIKQKQVIETKLQAVVDILGDIQAVLAD